MKKAVIIRYGAYGDCIVASFLPRLLKDAGFSIVDVETNFKGYQVFGNNPFVDSLIFYEPDPTMTFEEIKSHWQEIAKGYDKVINLFNSLEYGCIAMEGDELYGLPDKDRREILGDISFCDQTAAWAGYHELAGKYMPELYFTETEIKLTEEWLKQFKHNFLVLINVAGTSKHKRLVQAEEVVERILGNEAFPGAHIILTGDNSDHEFEGPRITSIIGKKPFMQAALISKYVGCVIVMESGLGLAAGVWGTPTVFLLTASSQHSVAKYARNCLVVQSPAQCSPCHKGPYNYTGCTLQDDLPVCVFFNIDDIVDRVGRAYEIYRNRAA